MILLDASVMPREELFRLLTLAWLAAVLADMQVAAFLTPIYVLVDIVALLQDILPVVNRPPVVSHE